MRTEVLKNEVYNFKFFTHIYKTKTGFTYYFCYDFGYMPVEDDKILIVNWQEYMKNKIFCLLIFSLTAFQGKAQELSLSESRALALEYNQKIKIADEMIAENESNVRFVFTQFLPNLKASGSYNYYHDIDDISLPGAFLPTANSLAEAQQGIYSGTSDVYFPGFNLELGNIDYFSSFIPIHFLYFGDFSYHNTYCLQTSILIYSNLGLEVNI